MSDKKRHQPKSNFKPGTDPNKIVECPLCLEIINPPIRQCETGHSMCKSCFDVNSLKNCPVCRGPMTDRRHVAFEQLLESVRDKLEITCCYTHKGCKYNLMGDKLSHEKECRHRPFNCEGKLFANWNCKWRGEYDGIEKHFQIESDFNQKFAEKADIIYSKLPLLANAILAEAETRKISVVQEDNVDPIVKALLTLPYLFSPITIKNKRKSGNWRPSRSEIAESFFLHIEDCHKDKTMMQYRTEATMKINFQTDYKDVHLISFFNGQAYFYYKHSVDVKKQKLYWLFQYVGLKNNAKNFFYEFEIFNGPVRKFKVAEICHNDTTKAQDLFEIENCVVMSFSAARNFLNTEGELPFRFRIIKIKPNVGH